MSVRLSDLAKFNAPKKWSAWFPKRPKIGAIHTWARQRISHSRALFQTHPCKDNRPNIHADRHWERRRCSHWRVQPVQRWHKIEISTKPWPETGDRIYYAFDFEWCYDATGEFWHFGASKTCQFDSSMNWQLYTWVVWMHRTMWIVEVARKMSTKSKSERNQRDNVNE